MPWLRWVERGAALRWRLTGLAYGDQGLLVRRSLYDAVGGYPDTRIMEDVVLVRRLARRRESLRLPAPILADARRWRREGRVRGTLRNVVLLSLFLAGVRAGPAGALVSTRASAPMTPALAVFLKAPRLGTVKTRLAAEIGERQALRLYRVLAHRTLAAVRAGGPRGHRLVHAGGCRDGDAASGWARAGTCGRRRRATSARGWPRRRSAVPPGRGWLAIGADCPRLDAALLREAAADRRAGRDRARAQPRMAATTSSGGRTPLPDLFSAMPWSTSRVLGETRARLVHATAPWHELPTLRDVDTAEDARAEGLLT